METPQPQLARVIRSEMAQLRNLYALRSVMERLEQRRMAARKIDEKEQRLDALLRAYSGEDVAC